VFDVSVPLNLTVPLGRNWKLAGGGGAVTTTVIVMLWTLMDFPRAAIVQTITLPPSPGAGAPQLAAAGVTVTESMASKGSMVMVNTTLLATVFVPFWTVDVRIPLAPGLIVLGLALPETGTEMFAGGGGGAAPGCVVRNSRLKVSDDPLASKPVTVDVRVMVAAFICTTTVMFSTCPGAMLETVQMVCVTPAPVALQLPASGTAEMMNAPSVVLRTLFTDTFWMGNSDAFVTTTP